MEETQQPQMPPQAPQQVQTDPPASKKGGAIIKALIGVFAIAIIGFGGWYVYNSEIFEVAEEETPPSLSLGAAGFQGKFVETYYKFLQFDDDDHVDRPGSIYMKSQTGVNYFVTKRDATLEEIVNSIKPIKGLKILIAFYDAEKPWPGPTENNEIKNGCFVTYPGGPYEYTCEALESELRTTIIGKNRGFAIISNLPSITHQPSYEYDSTLLADAKTLADTLTIEDFDGWTMHPISATMDLTNPRIRSMWIQKDVNEFEKLTNVANLDISREFKMAWFHLGDPTAPPTATGGGEIVEDSRQIN